MRGERKVQDVFEKFQENRRTFGREPRSFQVRQPFYLEKEVRSNGTEAVKIVGRGVSNIMQFGGK